MGSVLIVVSEPSLHLFASIRKCQEPFGVQAICLTHHQHVVDIARAACGESVLTFDHPVRGVGLDVEPAPAAVVPGQAYKVRMELIDTTTTDTVLIEKDGAIGACTYVAGRCADDRIGRMVLRVAMIGNGGQEGPVDFAVNRLELLTPVGNIV